MFKTYIYLGNNEKCSIHNNVLFDIVTKLEEILKTLNDGSVEETKNKITDIIIMMSHIINENNKNLEKINSEFRKLSESNNSFVPKEEIEFENGTYIGPYIDNKKVGKGIYIYNSGEKYEGEYVNNLREGRGIYYYKEGYRYDGEWKNDKKHGRGILYFPNGEVYEGEFEEGEFHGLGIFHYYNGDIFIGSFRNNLREGYGIKFTHDNSVIFGKYSNNKMTKSFSPNF